MDIGNSEIDALNRKLAGEYVTIDGHIIFRLVWSESVFENRYGTFREFTEGGLFIREVTETRRVRKYNYIHNRWIFEMWAPGNMVASRETPDAINGDYVPVYVFESGGGTYLPPNEKVVRFLIAALHGKIRRDEIPSREYLEEREIAETVESMDDHPSWFQTRPGAARNAIWYRGVYPQWYNRRAGFVDERFASDIERAAIEEAREVERRRQAERDERLAVAKEEIRQTLEIREKEREVERERERVEAEKRVRAAEMARVQKERLEKERVRAEKIEKMPVVEVPTQQTGEPKSPMHRR